MADLLPRRGLAQVGHEEGARPGGLGPRMGGPTFYLPRMDRPRAVLCDWLVVGLVVGWSVSYWLFVGWLLAFFWHID